MVISTIAHEQHDDQPVDGVVEDHTETSEGDGEFAAEKQAGADGAKPSAIVPSWRELNCFERPASRCAI
ncbi:hypothetical protein [Glutamicibacter mysorens]|uniref:hypothetical protein n=1 Tax=Glutamicibacter mysorens TaxID=257984 RepID=UPI0020C5BCB6|nr:hypothetical protein [Glutamicibacter mysorens]UTM47869.1 hypothetical protein XH9_03375 [Glutamicibacter mysorens]